MILGIESSCDESALALFSGDEGIKGQWVASQIALHREYGGVVPDLASREHLTNFPELLERMKGTAGAARFSEIAVTLGPGLAGCLGIGVALARSLHLSTGAPVVGINHLRAHAFSPFIPVHQEEPGAFMERIRDHLPHIGLLVSGGNTLLFHIGRSFDLKVLGGTVDDAAGEALDKGAKLLGLPYPGGPHVEAEARGGDPASFDFPRAFSGKRDLKFSFSGLKTSLRYRLEGMEKGEVAERRADLCAAYQEAVIDALVSRTVHALKGFPCVSLGLSGGVANNRRLRDRMNALATGEKKPLLVALPEHCGDNAAMIAFAAYTDRRGRVPAGRPGFRINPSWEAGIEGAEEP